MGWPLIIGALVIGAAQYDAPMSHDRLTYGMAGLMSTPTDLDLDLNTGEFSLQEGGQLPNPTVQQTHGRLNPSALAGIRKSATLALSKGLKTGACRRAEKRGAIMMPIMDAMPKMGIKLGSQWRTAPVNISCWSEAANELAGAVLDAVHKPAG